MSCIFCDLEVTDNRFWLGLDVPYVNLLVHKSCWRNNRDSLNEFFTNNYPKLLDNILLQSNKKIKNRSKTL